MVHAKAAEEKFIENGFGITRLPVMHNDFILVGPDNDPADLRRATSVSDALHRIVSSGVDFISRGDDSGTHKKEKLLWKAASVEPDGRWYLSVGQGMGAVLQIANDKLAYALTDRGTYLAYKRKSELEILYQGAEELLNPYHVIIVNPKRHSHVNFQLARKYVNFLQGKEGQNIIRDFTVNNEPLFYPDVIR